MQQDNLWGAAPRPTAFTFTYQRHLESDRSSVTVSLIWDNHTENRKGDYTVLDLETDEEDVVPFLFHTGFRQWQTTNPRLLVPTSLKRHLRGYREASGPQPAMVNGFHTVDFG